MTPLLSVKDLTLSLRKKGKELPLLENVYLTLNEGETVGIVGKSGSGKTLLALSLIQLLPPCLQIRSGSILFCEKDLVKMKEKELISLRGKEISIVLQDPFSSFNPTKKIEKQLIEGPIHHKILSSKQAHKQAKELLDWVGIDPFYLTSYPHQLSGGMLQRLSLAMSIASHPKILLADEPTTALDLYTKWHILSSLKKLQIEKKMSILLISHDLETISHFCDQIYFLEKGKLFPIKKRAFSPSHFSFSLNENLIGAHL